MHKMWIYICFILWCTSFGMMANGELRLLVIGGEVSSPMMNTYVRYIISDVELIDPFDADSSCINPPNIPFPRKCFISENLGGNRPFIIGGGNTGVMYVTSLILTNNTWWNTPLKLNHRRYCATSVQPQPNVMWVVGGDIDGAAGGMTTEILNNSTTASQVDNLNNINVNKFVNKSYIERSRFRDSFNAPGDDYLIKSRKCLTKLNDTHLFLTGYQNGQSYIVDTTTLPYSFNSLPRTKYGSHDGGACATIKDSLGVTRILVAGGGDTKLHNLDVELMKKTEFSFQ